MNTPVGTKAPPCACRRRCTAAKVRIIGAAEGSIIATIMTNHIRHMKANIAALQGCSCGIAMSPPAMPIVRAR